MKQAFDAILIVGFGGPEKPEDVIPFLENVLRGKNVSRERLLEVTKHYYQFDGISPINAQVRQLIESLRMELDSNGIFLPIYWGNRNWHPMLADTMQQMAGEGIHSALAVVLSAYSSYSSCRQYLENLETVRDAIGKEAPQIDKIRVFYNHPDFIAANADHLRMALDHFSPQQRQTLHIAYTAHSIPCSMAGTCDYEKQLAETCRLVSEELAIPQERWMLVYQSRSGRPRDPWLEPDICGHLTAIQYQGATYLLILPIGFLSDHFGDLYDLDHEARRVCETLGLNMVRAATPCTHPRFLAMLCKLIQERLTDSPLREAIGQCGPNHDICPAECCPAHGQPKS